MNKLENRWLELRSLDELTNGDSVIHRLNPVVKLITTLAFLVIVASFSKYDLAGLIPLIFYPVLLISLAGLPAGMLAKRTLLALPFVVFVGIFNPILDQTTLMHVGPLAISGGVVSFCSIMIRFTLTVLAALILVATTGIDAICGALSKLRVPHVVVVQILFLYRYLYVFIEEVGKTIRAHSLRSPYSSGIKFRVWGSFVGLLLLRTLDRAQRIYHAMLCRGFDGQLRILRSWRLTKSDFIFLFSWLIFFLAARIINIPQWLGTLVTGGKW